MVDVKNNVSKEEWETRQDLAAFYRTIPYFGWDDLIFTHISAKVPGTDDEFLINPNWEHDEHKALEEYCFKNNYEYEVLAISFFTKQVAVRLIGV